VVRNPAQIVRQSLQQLGEVSARGKDVVGALHVAPDSLPDLEARGVLCDKVVYYVKVFQLLFHEFSPFRFCVSPNRGDAVSSKPPVLVFWSGDT
jgi:hypothetical protein